MPTITADATRLTLRLPPELYLELQSRLLERRAREPKLSLNDLLCEAVAAALAAPKASTR